VTVGAQTAVVAANSETELVLAPVRPGAETAWSGDPPPPGSHYTLPDPPAVRPGITVNAAVVHPTIRGNRSWDSQGRTQTHGLWMTAEGRCVEGRVADNDLEHNAVAPTRVDTD
jgi:hypothetical protein